MNAEQILLKIGKRLTHIYIEDMTEAERQICKLLHNYGVLTEEEESGEVFFLIDENYED